MSARIRILLQLSLAAGLVVAAGCKTRPYPIRFNNDMARAVDRLNKAGREFYASVRPLERGEVVDPSDVRFKYQTAVKTLKEIQEQYEYIGPPMGTDNGTDLMEAFTAFLDGQQKILDEYLAKVVQIVDDNQLAPQDKWARIKPLLDDVDNVESQTRTPLVEYQKKWAEEHKLKLDK